MNGIHCVRRSPARTKKDNATHVIPPIRVVPGTVGAQEALLWGEEIHITFYELWGVICRGKYEVSCSPSRAPAKKVHGESIVPLWVEGRVTSPAHGPLNRIAGEKAIDES